MHFMICVKILSWMAFLNCFTSIEEHVHNIFDWKQSNV